MKDNINVEIILKLKNEVIIGNIIKGTCMQNYYKTQTLQSTIGKFQSYTVHFVLQTFLLRKRAEPEFSFPDFLRLLTIFTVRTEMIRQNKLCKILFRRVIQIRCRTKVTLDTDNIEENLIIHLRFFFAKKENLIKLTTKIYFLINSTSDIQINDRQFA